MSRLEDLSKNAGTVTSPSGAAKAAPATAVAAESTPVLLLSASGPILAAVLTFIAFICFARVIEALAFAHSTVTGSQFTPFRAGKAHLPHG